MPIDFGKIVPPKSVQRPTDPIALFQSLRVTDTAINDLWLAQGDALREWNKRRVEEDLAIVLNTGAGKTLVGLLAAQSLVNETSSHVVYACSSIQLVQQTASKARGYGLNLTTYVNGIFSNDHYQQGLAPCITTYQALFNGRSRFFGEDLAAVIFDDAHTAGHLLRDQFTLRITREGRPETFGEVVQIFRPYFARVGQELGYLESQDRRDSATSWFVPPFAVRQQLGELQRLLREASLGAAVETMFPWSYVRDHLDLCSVFVSGTDVSFTPAVVPVRTIPYFKEGVRRLYLSATLAAEDGFLRAFGRAPTSIIAPSTTAGECERLVLIPAIHDSRDTGVRELDMAKRIVAPHKCLVLVPTHRRASYWDDIASKSDESVAEQVEDFKKTDPPVCLVLTARYDGVDLPGDTCRVLVVDDLPSGLNPLERFLWERLGLGKLLRSTIASRVVQSLGRISRGMSDHGVVVLTGPRLVDWLLAPKNQSFLPEFLQRQLQLGIHISRQPGTVQDLVDAADQCLRRDDGWLDFYQRGMEDLQAQPTASKEVDEAVRMTEVEVEFGHALWLHDFAGAAKALERGLEETFTASRSTGAWHALWLGYCYELMGDMDRAHDLYDRAHQAERNIPAFDAPTTPQGGGTYTPQVLAVAASLQRGTLAHLEFPKHFDTELVALDGTGTVAQVEAAVEALGVYLGLDALRPDSEGGTGPDVLWITAGGPALSIEAKTGKGENAVYTKKDLGQLRDHRQWVREHFENVEVHSAFVGPVAQASPDANPDPDMVVIELGEFRALRDRLRAALIDVCTAAVPITAAMTVQDIFNTRRLLWPEAYERSAKHVLRDIVTA